MRTALVDTLPTTNGYVTLLSSDFSFCLTRERCTLGAVDGCTSDILAFMTQEATDCVSLQFLPVHISVSRVYVFTAIMAEGLSKYLDYGYFIGEQSNMYVHTRSSVQRLSLAHRRLVGVVAPVVEPAPAAVHEPAVERLVGIVAWLRGNIPVGIIHPRPVHPAPVVGLQRVVHADGDVLNSLHAGIVDQG